MTRLTGNIHVKIKIAEKDFPIEIGADEEEKIRHAGKLVNTMFTKYVKDFPGIDPSDALRLAAFEIATRLAHIELNTQKHDEQQQNLENEIEALTQRINLAL